MYDIIMHPHKSSGGTNPYDFITNPGTPSKKSLFGGGGPKLFPLLALAAIVLVVILLGLSVLGGGSLKKDYTTLLQQQTEILRVSDAGIKEVHGTAAKNFAITTKEFIFSQQNIFTKQAASSAKVKVKAKDLAKGKNADTDKKLTTGRQANKYDETLVAILKDDLKQYQQTLKKIYDQTNKKADKTALDEAYAAAQILIDAPVQDVNAGTTDGTPATN